MLEIKLVSVMYKASVLFTILSLQPFIFFYLFSHFYHELRLGVGVAYSSKR